MAVIPICTLQNQTNELSRTCEDEVGYRLFPWVECVKEALQRYNWALVDESTTVDVIGMCLEYTMPVLRTISVLLPLRLKVRRDAYDSSHQVHG